MTESNKKRILVLCILMVLLITLFPGDGQITGNIIDKVVHFGAFFILAMAVIYKFSHKRSELLLWCILFGLFTEVAQQYIPGRNMDMYDGVADTIGVIAAYYVFPDKLKQ